MGKKFSYIFIIICLFFSLFISNNGKNFLNATPLPQKDSIITNNKIIDYYDNINAIADEISSDNYNYTFKKEEIITSINDFKIISNYVSYTK